MHSAIDHPPHVDNGQWTLNNSIHYTPLADRKLFTLFSTKYEQMFSIGFEIILWGRIYKRFVLWLVPPDQGLGAGSFVSVEGVGVGPAVVPLRSWNGLGPPIALRTGSWISRYIRSSTFLPPGQYNVRLGTTTTTFLLQFLFCNFGTFVIQWFRLVRFSDWGKVVIASSNSRKGGRLRKEKKETRKKTALQFTYPPFHSCSIY